MKLQFEQFAAGRMPRGILDDFAHASEPDEPGSVR
jgi:hypothetical protein